MGQQGFYTNKFVTTTAKMTERDRYEGMKFYLNICSSNEEMPVSRDEAIKLFKQIDRFKNPKFREDLFERLAKYIGLFYDDDTKSWEPILLSDD